MSTALRLSALAIAALVTSGCTSLTSSDEIRVRKDIPRPKVEAAPEPEPEPAPAAPEAPAMEAAQQVRAAPVRKAGG